MSLKNLFKHKLPFYFHCTDIEYEDSCAEGMTYHFNTDVVEDGSKIGIDTPSNLYNKMIPFIRYIISKMKNELPDPYSGIFNIYLSKNFCESTRVVHFELTYNFTFEDIHLLEYISRYNESLFKTPFNIYVKATCYFGLKIRRSTEDEEDEEEESDESDESEESNESKDKDEDGAITINEIKTYKTDECVICLENKNNVLFCNCGHICVCKKCIEIKRLTKCPVCKTKNTILRIIE